MLKIDRISLRLPAGYESRAEAIARELAYQIAVRRWPESMSLETLDVEILERPSGTIIGDLTKTIAVSIRDAAVTKSRTGGRG